MTIYMFSRKFKNFEISMSIYMFFSSVFDSISKANLWPPKAAEIFVMFLIKFIKQMI